LRRRKPIPSDKMNDGPGEGCQTCGKPSEDGGKSPSNEGGSLKVCVADRKRDSTKAAHLTILTNGKAAM